MGLFSNNKKPCPICGEATPRLLATCIADKTPICSHCSAKISMVDTQVRELSVEGLKEHLAKRVENANLLANTFFPNISIPIGWTHLNIDEKNRLFTIPLNMCGDTKNPPIFKFEELTGYDLQEEYCVIERFQKGDIVPQCTPMLYTPVMQYDFNDEEQNRLTTTRDFRLNLYLSNPCWDKVESSAGSASGDHHDFQRNYSKHLIELRQVTTALANIIGVGVPEKSENDADSISDDLKKFKELLDGGIITQEEFDIKKKQILGI